MEGIKNILNSGITILKISVFFLFVLFLPHVMFFQNKQLDTPTTTQSSHIMTLGLENITPEFLQLLSPNGAPYKAAIMTNHTGKDQQGNRNIDLLIQKGIPLSFILVPQHGFYASHTAGGRQEIQTDSPTQLPIIGWYDAHKKHRSAINAVDVIFFDLQDSGMRHGYVSTLLDVMRETRNHKKKLVILDRPNILGSGMEGYVFKEIQKMNNKLPIPVRHGMTSGELARYFNDHLLESPVQLYVVPMRNYARSSPITQLASHISPHLKTINACYGHSFLGLLGEISPFDIGIGTDHPFQCLLLPDRLHVRKKTWFALQEALKVQGIESTYYRCWHTRKKQYYSGLQLSIRDINNFSSYSSLLTIIDFFTDKGIKLSFSDHFDRAVGTQRIREYAQGSLSRKELECTLYEGLKNFFAKASSSLLYQPAPKIMRI